MAGHRAYQLYAHITWHTSRRVPCVDRRAVGDVLAAVAHACAKCNVRVLRRAVLADHVHLLISYRPSTRLSDFMRICKGVSSMLTNRRVPGSLRWARGYYIRSVEESGLRVVDRYILRQFDRHPDLLPKTQPIPTQPTSDPRR